VRKLVVGFAVLAMAAIASLGLVACGGGSDSTGGGGDGEGGGILNVTYNGMPDYLDPALSYTAEGWTAMNEVYIPLLTYKHANGEEGSEVIPGLAKDLPKISNGGKTYTLFLRPGLKYSDGQPVKASDFKFAVERMIKLTSGGSPFYTAAIEGAEEFAETRKGGIPGIETDDKTGEIVINLAKPRGTFTNELALMFVAPLPQDTPIKDLTQSPPPGTGPYVITNVKTSKGWEYERNPSWASANSKAMPDLPTGSIDGAKVTFISNAQTQVDDVEAGTQDWMQNLIPSSRYADVKNRFEGTQMRVEPTISNYYFWMNTTKAPFDDVKVRQAVNYAVSSEALERIYAGQLTGNRQILPPGIPGHEEFDLYPYDVAKAKQLIKEANPADMDITVWGDNESPNDEAAEYLNDILQEIGFNTQLKILNADNYFTVIGNATTPNLDVGWSDWFQDYPHPNDFFQPLLAGESILPNNNGNFAQFDNPEVNATIAQLSEEDLGPEQEETAAKLDKEIMEEAPWAPYGALSVATFVSDQIDLDKVIFNLTLGQYLSSFEFK
jgi:peptide/nickel transport system substrate-binding protein